MALQGRVFVALHECGLCGTSEVGVVWHYRSGGCVALLDRGCVALQERVCVALQEWGLCGTAEVGVRCTAGVGVVRNYRRGAVWHYMSGGCVALQKRGCVALQEWGVVWHCRRGSVWHSTQRFPKDTVNTCSYPHLCTSFRTGR